MAAVVAGLRGNNSLKGLLLAGAAGISIWIMVRRSTRRRFQQRRQPWISSPKESTREQIAHSGDMPYPPDIFPGERNVETPYGNIKVFECGPEDGERVLLMHGIGTPCIALGSMWETFRLKGYRVMLFDFFGRGYSDAPIDVPYDMRLYTSQILLALASSKVPWTGDEAFHLVGFSLGAAIAASFAGYFPHMVSSLTLVGGGGLIRSHHISWRSHVLYSKGILPARFLEWLVRRQLMPGETQLGRGASAGRIEAEPLEMGDEESTGGSSGDPFNDATLWVSRPYTVADVMRWQIRNHAGFVRAYISSIQHAPIYEQREDWTRLAELLEKRRGKRLTPSGLRGGKVLLVLGESDTVVVKEEVIPDTTDILGKEAVQVKVLEGGHEFGIVRGDEVANAAIHFWELSKLG